MAKIEIPKSDQKKEMHKMTESSPIPKYIDDAGEQGDLNIQPMLLFFKHTPRNTDILDLFDIENGFRGIQYMRTESEIGCNLARIHLMIIFLINIRILTS